MLNVDANRATKIVNNFDSWGLFNFFGSRKKSIIRTNISKNNRTFAISKQNIENDYQNGAAESQISGGIKTNYKFFMETFDTQETTHGTTQGATENVKQPQTYQLEFFGKGSEYFSIWIVNWILTILTLGIYYPWAKAKKLKYTFGQTALNGERFNFAGEGNEMFSGWIKVFVFEVIAIAIAFILGVIVIGGWQGMLVYVLLLFASLLITVPLILHGGFRYVMQRTTYRGIRFGYRGDRALLVKNYIKWTLLMIVTFGIYYAWLEMKVRRYTHQNIRYGDAEFNNDCYGGDFFLINLKGILLSIITLGIYMFWWQKEVFNYYIDRMSATKGDQKIKFHSTATGLGFLELRVINFFLVVFTLGFGAAWAAMRVQRFLWSHIKIEGDINIDEIQQTEAEYDKSQLDILDINNAYIIA